MDPWCAETSRERDETAGRHRQPGRALAARRAHRRLGPGVGAERADGGRGGPRARRHRRRRRRPAAAAAPPGRRAVRGRALGVRGRRRARPGAGAGPPPRRRRRPRSASPRRTAGRPRAGTSWPSRCCSSAPTAGTTAAARCAGGRSRGARRPAPRDDLGVQPRRRRPVRRQPARAAGRLYFGRVEADEVRGAGRGLRAGDLAASGCGAAAACRGRRRPRSSSPAPGSAVPGATTWRCSRQEGAGPDRWRVRLGGSGRRRSRWSCATTGPATATRTC